MDGRSYGMTDGRTDGQTDGRMDGRTDRRRRSDPLVSPLLTAGDTTAVPDLLRLMASV